MKNVITLMGLALCACIVFTSCEEEDTGIETPVVKKIELYQDAALGDYLVDYNGITLYYFSKDVDGTSKCSGNCEANWPVFYQADVQVGSGLQENDFGTITRADGTQQTTYKGWPLYYYAGDQQVGEIKGEGLGGNWFIAKPDYDVMIAQKTIDGKDEKYLVDIQGKTLYIFTADSRNQSNCSGGCLSAWPTYAKKVAVAPSTIDIGKFGIIQGNDGRDQSTFDGRPLYYYGQDISRGDVNGQGAGGSWYVLTEADITQ